MRALVLEQPLLAVAGAFATGFVLGGGWRSRLGRFLMSSAARAAVVEGAARYLSKR